MAGRSTSARGGGKPRPRDSGRTPAGRPTTRAKPARPKTEKVETPAPTPTGPFRLGAVEGATPGKWIDRWRERLPHAALELVPLQPGDERAALLDDSVDGSVHAALVRLPMDRTGLHVIALYDEVTVVVCAADSHLTAADELTFDDLAGEVVITPRRPPLEVDVPGTIAPRFDPPETVADAIAIAASAVGVVIVPLSLARLHHRKDAAHRPLVGGPVSPVALAWREGGTTPEIEAFIGIVRGRTANSSR